MGERGHVFLEIRPLGRLVKVIAIDPESGVEVSVFGPASAAKRELEALAVAKLEARLRREGKSPPGRFA